MYRSKTGKPKKARLLWAFLFVLPVVTLAQNPRYFTITDSTAVNPNEVSVAVNPLNPDHIVAVSMQFKPSVTNFSYVSTNGGVSWKTAQHHNPQRRVQGDDAISFSAAGLAARSYISFDGIRQKKPRKARSGIFVTTSGDGLTWSEPVAAIDHLNTVRPFEDKPWLTFDIGASSPGRGRLLLSWTRFDEYQSTLAGDSTHIYFTASDDSGRSFRPPFRIDDTGGNCLDDGNTVEGAVPVAGPDGTIYVAWSGPRGIMIDRSTDGGWTFGADTKVADHIGGWSFGARNMERHNGMPVLRSDVSGGPRNGTLYIAFIDRRNGAPDVFLTSSPDGARSWSPPVRVNADKPGGADQLFVWMAVDPVDGSVNLVYYDRSVNPDGKVGVTYARSINGGQSFTYFTSPDPGFEFDTALFFGDYIGIDAVGGRTALVYTRVQSPGKLVLRCGVYSFVPGTVTLRKP